MEKFLTSIRAFFARLFGQGYKFEPQDASELEDVVEEVETPEEPAPTPELADATPELAAEEGPRYLWCIDNGHGAGTAGKRSPKLEDGRQLFEYEFNRIISDAIFKRLDQRGIQYLNVCPEVEGDIALSTRVSRANSASTTLPKIFVSIHANASTNGGWETRDIRGTEIWYYGGSDNGKRIASVFMGKMLRKVQFRDRGIRYHSPLSKSFYVLRKTSMPAILIECGFYTTQEECLRMLDQDTQERMASSMVEAIAEIESNGYEQQPFHSKVVRINLS